MEFSLENQLPVADTRLIMARLCPVAAKRCAGGVDSRSFQGVELLAEADGPLTC